MNSKRKKYCIAYGIFLLIYFSALAVLKILAENKVISEKIITTGVVLFPIILFLPFVIWGVLFVINYFVSSVRNIHSCGDTLFDELDYYGIHWGETKEHYEDMINAVQFYYKTGGKVDSVVGKDLKKLYNRLDFLKRELNTKEHLYTCFISVGLSICATLFFEFSFGKFQNQIFFYILFIVLFFVLVLLRYYKPFSEESNQIYKYEMKLLKEKIADAEKEVLIDYQKEDMMLTKQNVLNELMDKCFFASAKKREDISKDIRIVGKLNLNIQSTSELKEVIFCIGKKKRQCVLYLDKNNHLATEQYEILYKILRKYNMIYELSEEDKK